MSQVHPATVPKWPFFLADGFLLATAWFVYSQSPPPLAGWQLLAFCVCAGLGAAAGILPFWFEHLATLRQLDNTALGSAADRLGHLQEVAAQIAAATNEWQNVQLQSEKTSGAAREITEQMTSEVRAFTEFLQKANDNEKATLRLEVEKLRRAEGDWLQVLIHLLDHVHALYSGAARSGQPRLADQIKQFQSACHDAARRVGLIPFAAAPGEAFDVDRHRTPEEGRPSASASVAETLAAGFSFQGRLVRPALVRLKDSNGKPSAATVTASSEQNQLPLESPDANSPVPEQVSTDLEAEASN